MRYLKLILSTILILFVAAIAIWVGVFAAIFSVIAAPILAFWIRYKAKKAASPDAPNQQEPADRAHYKVIEAEYEIIEK
jgi:hypothetical protein